MSFLYICATYYHVYIMLVKALVLHQRPDVIICDDIPGGKELAKRLDALEDTGHVWFLEQRKFTSFIRKPKILEKAVTYLKNYSSVTTNFPVNLHHYSDVYIFYDGTPIGNYLMDQRKTYHLVEDSLNFYQLIDQTVHAALLPNETIWYWIKKNFKLGHLHLGGSPYVLDIEVNSAKDLKIVHPCILEVSRKSLLEQLNTDQVEKILNVFTPELPMDELKKQPFILLLTQPFVADGLLTAQEQYYLYEKIIMFLREKSMPLYVKRHPRDDVDYSILVPENHMLTGCFPIEMMNYYTDVLCHTVVTVSSSAVQTVNAKFIVYFTMRGEIDCEKSDHVWNF